MENMIYLKDVVTLNLNEEKCIGCGMCIEVCPHAVIGMNGAERVWNAGHAAAIAPQRQFPCRAVWAVLPPS
jgi:Fe-S-cluster-containing hydrogenase component 2